MYFLMSVLGMPIKFCPQACDSNKAKNTKENLKNDLKEMKEKMTKTINEQKIETVNKIQKKIYNTLDK